MQETIDTRATGDLLRLLRTQIDEGRYRDGSYLPSVRQLARAHALSPETVRRGLMTLSREGLLEVRPRRGFLVRRARAAETRQPVAYVTQYRQDLSDAQPVNWAIDRALTAAAGAEGRGMLGVHVADMREESMRGQLEAAHACGIVLDTLVPEQAAAVRAMNLPVVMINAWLEGSDFSVVLQDNYLGGYLAAQHLVERGAKRIAWINPVGAYCHSRERFAGAVAGLAAHGRTFDPRDILDTGDDALNDANTGRLVEMLRREDRPDGALIFWADIARVARRTFSAAGLRIGADLKVVGWMVDELFTREHVAVYEGVETPPAVTWKARSMAESALRVLHESRAHPMDEPRRVLIPTRVRTA